MSKELNKFHYRIFVYDHDVRYCIFIRRAFEKENGKIKYQLISIRDFETYSELKIWLDMMGIDKSSFIIKKYHTIDKNVIKFILETKKG